MANQIHVKKLKEGVTSWNKWRNENLDVSPDLRNEDLHGKMLTQIDFRRTNLDGADLQNANLCSALLDAASFYRADLSGAKLRKAVLHKTCLKETILQHTNFYQAHLLDTMFLNLDLSETINLENAFHLGPSTIDIDTIQRSKEQIKEAFLCGVGVSMHLITSIKSSGISPVDYYTCFISYSSEDERFVKKLHQDLSNAGVHCWFAPENLVAGDKFPMHITEAVHSSEKVLVVLSKSSLKSTWVEKEVELARQKERNRKNVLIPIMLDNAIERSKVRWAAAIQKRRDIGSFENWHQLSPSHYEKRLKELLKALRKP